MDDSGIEPLSRQSYCRLLSFTTVIAHIETHYGRVHSHTRNLASGHITSIGVLLYGVRHGIRTRILKLFHRYRTFQYCVSTIDLCGPLSCPLVRRNAHELVDCMRLEPMSDQECDGAHSIMLLRLLTVHVTFLDNPKQNRNRYTCQLICACTALKAVSGRHSAFPPTSKLGAS